MTIQRRKDEHLDIVLQHDIEHGDQSLLDGVDLMHQSLPELDLDQVDTTTHVFGRSCAAPLLITGMTGGSDRARVINLQLAELAQQARVVLGVGSMRPAFGDAARIADYDLRATAPDVALLGNLGVTQARQMPVDEVAELLKKLDYDALCIHLNPAQELAQREGDRGFAGCIDAIEQYRYELGLPLIVKETGAGLSPQALDRLRAAGVEWVDVAGKGGTSWTKVEAARPDASNVGNTFGNWGIPTAPSTAWAARRGFRTICSGGIRSVPQMLAGLALGATLVGAARPVLIALENSPETAAALLRNWIDEIRSGLLLCGVRTPGALAGAPRLIHPELARWLAADPEIAATALVP